MLFLAVGIFFLADAENFRKNFLLEDKLFLLTENGELLSGFSTTDFQDSKYLSEEEILGFSQSLENLDLESIKGSYDRLYVVDALTFNEDNLVDLTIPGTDLELTFSQYFEIMTRETAFEGVFQLILQNEQSKRENPINQDSLRGQLNSRIGNDYEVRARFFEQAFERSINEKSLVFILENSDDTKLAIHPKPLIFKLRPIAPVGILDTIKDGLRD